MKSKIEILKSVSIDSKFTKMQLLVQIDNFEREVVNQVSLNTQKMIYGHFKK